MVVTWHSRRWGGSEGQGVGAGRRGGSGQGCEADGPRRRGARGRRRPGIRPPATGLLALTHVGGKRR
ncbi:hypothetical protein DIJ69_31080 [Streptomyces globisporus]|nr:hypothetical protein DIJ69_31080 [Streptomyces globisporus]